MNMIKDGNELDCPNSANGIKADIACLTISGVNTLSFSDLQ